MSKVVWKVYKKSKRDDKLCLVYEYPTEQEALDFMFWWNEKHDGMAEYTVKQEEVANG
jgi:hypothetical protein